MIIFVSDTFDIHTDKIRTLPVVDGLHQLLTYVRDNGITDLGIDTETTGLEPWYHKVLLTIIGDETVQYVIDNESAGGALTVIISALDELVTWTGHNLKFDYSMIYTNLSIKLSNLYDTMIAEQRLYANLGFSNRLEDVVFRNTGRIPPAMNKDIRREFIGANPKSFIFESRHIEYAANDISELFKIKRVQAKAIAKYDMSFLLEEIEFPLIKIIAHAEMEGLNLNTTKLAEIITNNKVVKYEKEKALDEIVRTLRDGTTRDKAYLTAGKYDRVRNPTVDVVPNLLFDVPIDTNVTPKKKAKAKATTAVVNYASATQIIYIFGRLGLPLPTKRGVYKVPIFDPQGKLLNKHEEFTTGEAAFEQYLIDNPTSIAKDFIKTLIDYREMATEINKYGDTFPKKINSVTGKIHTIFRQCDAVNGRFQSGGGLKQPDKINIQNIPRKKEFREIFYSEGYAIVTADLKGAEVVVMADKANDHKLFELAIEGDIHSHMAQTGWRNIFMHREEYELAATFIVSQTVNKDSHRTPCKNLTFGAVYGCGEAKAAKTINVSRAEGRIYIDTIKSEIPLTFRMVEANSALAKHQGYLVLNQRTKARIWFPQVRDAYKERRPLEFSEEVEIDGQARNVPISGTQADIVKEAIVEIDKYIKEHNLDCNLLIQVHDEVVYRCPHDIKEEFGQIVRSKLTEVAAKYLTNIMMDADVMIKDTWTK